MKKSEIIKAISEVLKEEKPGLWANIRAKRAKGEKPAHKNSNAHKDAVAAGKEINAMKEGEAQSYKKGDKLKIKLPNGKEFDVVFVDYSRTKGIAYGKFKDGGEVVTKPFSLDFIVESVNEAAMNPVKKVVNAILKKHNVQAMKTYASSVRGAHNIINGGYRYEGDYFLGFYGNVPQDVIEKVGADMKKAGVKDVDVRKGTISADFTKNGLNEANVNPEAEKLVGNFIMKLAKRYGYGAKDAIYLIQDVIKNIEASGKLNENEDWPKEHPSRHGDMTFRLDKVTSNGASYEILDAENGNKVMGRMAFKSPDSLKAFALDYIKPQGGRQSSHFGTK